MKAIVLYRQRHFLIRLNEIKSPPANRWRTESDFLVRQNSVGLTVKKGHNVTKTAPAKIQVSPVGILRMSLSYFAIRGFGTGPQC